MSRPSEQELDRLRIVAGEIITTLEAEGYAVGQALGQHRAFRAGRLPASSLERALVKDAAERGAWHGGMYTDHVGHGMDLVSTSDMIERRYRIKVATYSNGEPHIVCSRSSTLLHPTQDPTLIPVEQWLLCFRTDEDSTIVEIFATEVKGHVEKDGDGPVPLILGPLYPLNPISPPDGFIPDHDDDLGDLFEDDSDFGEGVA